LYAEAAQKVPGKQLSAFSSQLDKLLPAIPLHPGIFPSYASKWSQFLGTQAEI
jgi:hypothetical protein